MKLFFLVFILFVSIARSADYYPASNRFGDFQPGIRQGVVGGIPDRSGGSVIQASTYGFATGASAATNAAAISSALAASSEGDVIALPAGTFSMEPVVVNYPYPNRTIRGAGMTSTTINATGTVAFFINGDSDYQNPFNPSAPLATLTSGSATITVTDATGLPSPTDESNYRVARIMLHNEAVTPVVSTQGYSYNRTPSVMLVSRSGTTLTLSQPLPSNFPNGMTGAYVLFGSQFPRNMRGFGIEELTVDGTAAGLMREGVYFSFVTNSWAKNVKVLGHGTYAIRFSDTVNCEARGCWTDVGTGGGSNFAGLKLEQCSYFLAEDNILVNNSPTLEVDYSTSFLIFGYNYSGGGEINRNHGPHNSFNLYEGNVYWFDKTDGYYGGSSEETIFRTYMRGGIVTVQKRLTRNNNVVGNVVGSIGGSYTTDGSENWGKPNIGNLASSGTWDLANSVYSLDWNPVTSAPYVWTGTLKTRIDDRNGVFELDSGMVSTLTPALANSQGNKRNLSYPNGVDTSAITVSTVVGNDVTFIADNTIYVLPSAGEVMWIVPGATGFQELDEGVAPTAIRKANFYVLTGNIPTGESIGADTLPNSYYLPAKPDWFGTIGFPAFDPYSPPASDAAGLVAIPAGWRYINGNSNYLNGNSTANVTNLNVGTIRLAP